MLTCCSFQQTVDQPLWILRPNAYDVVESQFGFRPEVAPFSSYPCYWYTPGETGLEGVSNGYAEPSEPTQVEHFPVSQGDYPVDFTNPFSASTSQTSTSLAELEQQFSPETIFGPFDNSTMLRDDVVDFDMSPYFKFDG